MKSVDEVDDLVDEIKELIEEVSCCLPNFFYDAAYFDAMDLFLSQPRLMRCRERVPDWRGRTQRPNSE